MPYDQESSCKSGVAFVTGALNKRQVRLNTDFIKVYFKRRNLILALLASEYDRWVVWYDPLNVLVDDLAEINETKLPAWMNQLVTPRMLREYAKVAWQISPVLAVYLPPRYLAICLII